MVREGDSAPNVTATMATGGDEFEEFSLEDALRDGPVVLAFFPLAYSSVCTSQVCDIQDNYYDHLRELDAQVYGVSVDSPYVLERFREEEGLSYPLVSDFNREIVEAFGVATDSLGFENLAQRAVFVVDREGTVVYADVLEDGSQIPDMAPVEDALASLSA
jgi:peroxiredoxin